MVGRNSSDLPPGFRFHPTDEELIVYYLRNQAISRPCPVSIIPEVDIYKFDPWDLPEKTEFGENEWYFFTPRDRKYPNGVRPNRAAVSGYWKATGTDKSIYSGSKYVGVKKALVFYQGRPPKGIKTDWIMHEYRLSEPRSQPNKQNGSMRLDDWVLCRIYKKKNLGKALDIKAEDQSTETLTTADAASCEPQQTQLSKFPRICSLSHLWEMECMGTISQLFGDNSYNAVYDNQNIVNSNGNHVSRQLGEVPHQFQGNQSGILNQPVYVHPVYEFQ
ncbi:NAC domain-containing protein 2-like [Coffea eugenioides]|uniref:NAC domain-containing protein 2-like n=1 Tax=Coffea eugenioides TaxID=49369 RepID=UPI000F60D8D1|nr:NAC domain-containing protein 2-like [Coffea eugenioides]